MSNPEMIRADLDSIRAEVKSEFPDGPRQGLEIPTAEQWARANEIAGKFGKSIEPMGGGRARNLAFLRSRLVRILFAGESS